jgi:hypothetical protein
MVKSISSLFETYCLGSIYENAKMGRLPFDLSNLNDAHLNPSKGWGVNAFVRSYFAYLDQKSAFVSSELKNLAKNHNKEV